MERRIVNTYHVIKRSNAAAARLDSLQGGDYQRKGLSHCALILNK